MWLLSISNVWSDFAEVSQIAIPVLAAIYSFEQSEFRVSLNYIGFYIFILTELYWFL